MDMESRKNLEKSDLIFLPGNIWKKLGNSEGFFHFFLERIIFRSFGRYDFFWE